MQVLVGQLKELVVADENARALLPAKQQPEVRGPENNIGLPLGSPCHTTRPCVSHMPQKLGVQWTCKAALRGSLCLLGILARMHWVG